MLFFEVIEKVRSKLEIDSQSLGRRRSSHGDGEGVAFGLLKGVPIFVVES